MDTNETRQTEAALTALELKVVERLRQHDGEIEDRVRTVESKLQSIQQIFWAIIAVAVIFGLTGAWGMSLLLRAKAELEETGNRVTELSSNVQKLGPVAQQQIESLQSAGTEQLKQFRNQISTADTEFRRELESLQTAGTEQLKQFRENARREADEESGPLRGEISIMELKFRQQIESLQSTGTEQLKHVREEAKQAADAASADLRTELSKEVQTRALKIVSANGQPLVALTAGYGGGEVKVFGTTWDEPIAFVGATSDGDSVVRLSNRSGRELLRGIASGNGGRLFTYNPDNGMATASLGSSANGSGSLFLLDKVGNIVLNAQASDKGGNIFLYNPENAKLIANFGTSADGNGFWLSNKSGQEVLKGIAANSGGYLFSSDKGEIWIRH